MSGKQAFLITDFELDDVVSNLLALNSNNQMIPEIKRLRVISHSSAIFDNPLYLREAGMSRK